MSPFSALEWLGRQGTRAIAVSLLVGMCFPALSSLLRPFVGFFVFLLVTLAFLRFEVSAVKAQVRAPLLPLIATAFLMIITPCLALFFLVLLGFLDEGVAVIIICLMVACGPATNSAPAFSALLNLNGPLALIIVVSCMIITPITVPVFAALVLPEAFEVSSLDLAIRLFAILGGAFVASFLVRRFFGEDRVRNARTRIDGASVVMLFFFAAAAMDGVALGFLEQPLLMLKVMFLAFAIAFAQLFISLLLFYRQGPEDALTIGICAANRNLGLMVAAFGTALPDLAWLFFALGQFPIYFMPYLIGPLARRIKPSH